MKYFSIWQLSKKIKDFSKVFLGNGNLIIYVDIERPTGLYIGQESLIQGWATLFGSLAKLETKLVYVGQYKYHWPIWLGFKEKMVF